MSSINGNHSPLCKKGQTGRFWRHFLSAGTQDVDAGIEFVNVWDPKCSICSIGSLRRSICSKSLLMLPALHLLHIRFLVLIPHVLRGSHFHMVTQREIGNTRRILNRSIDPHLHSFKYSEPLSSSSITNFFCFLFFHHPFHPHLSFILTTSVTLIVK